jgi:hypothetical protein
MIQRTFFSLALTLCVGLLASGPLRAHHSLAGVYDMKGDKELAGTVVDVKFTNPHGSLGVEVKNDDGTTTKWVMTLGSATSLAPRGIGKTGPNALHLGDPIKIRFLPAKNGSPLGFLRSVTMPDGRIVQVALGNASE